MLTWTESTILCWKINVHPSQEEIKTKGIKDNCLSVLQADAN